MQSKGEAHFVLSNFFFDIGIPTIIHSDDAKELILGEFKRKCKNHSIKQTVCEPCSHWQNPAEKAIGLTKRISARIMQKTNTPIQLWDYAYEYAG